MNDNQNPKDKSKILSMDKYRRSEGKTEINHEPVHQLLNHMRKVREEIPVNRRLQHELKQKLLHGQINDGTQPVPNGSINGQRPKLTARPWIYLALVCALLGVAVLAIWLNTAETQLKAAGNPVPVIRFWNADENVTFTASPEGELLVARHGKLLIADQFDDGYRVLNLPTKWLYHSPAFSPDGNRVALVRRGIGYIEQIIVIETNDLLKANAVDEVINSKRILEGKNEHNLRNLTWSPDGNQLAFTEIDENDAARVRIVSEEGITKFESSGMHPAWSPDGSKIILQRERSEGNYYLYLVDIKIGLERLLGQGEQAAWGENGFVAFILPRQEERVLTFLPDGSPQFTVHQRVGEIRSIYAGSNGVDLAKDENCGENWVSSSNLLVSHSNDSAGVEMNWLQKLELEGVREPRVLSLDEVDQCRNPIFGLQGKTLFFARQEYGLGTVLKVHLEERLWDKGEKQI